MGFVGRVTTFYEQLLYCLIKYTSHTVKLFLFRYWFSLKMRKHLFKILHNGLNMPPCSVLYFFCRAKHFVVSSFRWEQSGKRQNTVPAKEENGENNPKSFFFQEQTQATGQMSFENQSNKNYSS